MNYTSNSEQETKKIASQVASTLTGGEILCLHGNLGAGKTTFVKGLAEAFGITDTVTSPTFTLMNTYLIKTQEHKNIKTLVHIDTYRLKDEHELRSVGVEDYLGETDTITVVEWPEKIAPLLANKKIINIFFEHGEKDNRSISIDSFDL